MQNLKPLALFAGIGFVLSLIIGFISGVKLEQVFFRAFLSAVFSGLFAWGIAFLFSKVFENLQELEMQQGDDIKKEVLGANVNISLGDDSLDEDENAPHFYVNQDYEEAKPDLKQKFSEDFAPSEIKKETALHPQEQKNKEATKTLNTTQADEDDAKKFQPRSLVEKQFGSSKEKGLNTDDAGDLSSLEELDELPTLSEINKEMGAEENEAKELGTGTMQVEHMPDRPSEDVSTMAQAIRTVLTKDS